MTDLTKPTDQAMQPTNAVTDIFRGMNAMQIADHFVKSGYFKDARDVSQAVVKIMAGAEMGIPPMAAMMGIHIVEGKPSLSGNLLAAQIKRHPKYDYKVLVHTDTECQIEFFEGRQSLGVVAFTMADAAKAGLAGRNTWKNYPKNMLFNRVISNGAKWHCPDVFNGVPVYYEGEIEDAKAVELEPVQQAAHPFPEQYSGPDAAEQADVDAINDLLKLEIVPTRDRTRYQYALADIVYGNSKDGATPKQRAKAMLDALRKQYAPAAAESREEAYARLLERAEAGTGMPSAEQDELMAEAYQIFGQGSEEAQTIFNTLSSANA